MQRRAGIPEDTAALIDEMTADHVALTLVNVSQTQPRTVIVQTGAYAEHKCTHVESAGARIDVGNSSFSVQLSPGSSLASWPSCRSSCARSTSR